jgi:phosphoglucosamine mutase
MTWPPPALFGTDGIRGNADADLTPELVRDIGRAVAAWAGGSPRVVVGRDTRVSGPKLEQAFVDGACSLGAEVLLAGVIPTAGIAYLTTLLDCDVGIVVSASHNPPQDNGIKIFGRGGWKLSSTDEHAIESSVGARGPSRSGSVTELTEGAEAYVEHLGGAATHDLRGMRAVVDCANGAASEIAPAALRRLGVDVSVINAELDGTKINDRCGALHPEVVARTARGADAIGLTFDGDADRALASDENGRLIDGDAVLAILARELKDEGRLAGNAVVTTIMANQALRRWCAAEDIELIETAIGDRNVLRVMRERGLVLGGEQSGHIIRLDQATTGDGVLTGIAVLDAMAAAGRRLADLVPFTPYPQVIVNVRTSKREGSESDRVRVAVADATKRLGADGRILVRTSGTEPVVRVMVECADEAIASRVADEVADVVRDELGGER